MDRSFGSVIEAANTALFVNGHLDAIGEFFTDDYVVHLTDRDMTGGHKAIRKVLGLYRNAFPDVQVEVEMLVEAEDRAAWRRTFRGVQRGAFQGFPASGRMTVWRDMVVSRFRDGLISEEWLTTDLAERLLLARKR